MPNFRLPADPATFKGQILDIKYPDLSAEEAKRKIHSHLFTWLKNLVAYLNNEDSPIKSPSQQHLILLGAVIATKMAIRAEYTFGGSGGTALTAGSGLHNAIKELDIYKAMCDSDDHESIVNLALRSFHDWYEANVFVKVPVEEEEGEFKIVRPAENPFSGEAKADAIEAVLKQAVAQLPAISSDLYNKIDAVEDHEVLAGGYYKKTEPKLAATSTRWGLPSVGTLTFGFFGGDEKTPAKPTVEPAEGVKVDAEVTAKDQASLEEQLKAASEEGEPAVKAAL